MSSSQFIRNFRNRSAIIGLISVCALTTSGCPGGGNDDSEIARAASALVKHGSEVLFGKLPEVRTTYEIQQDTLRGDIKSAACDWLSVYITSGWEPPSEYFYKSLQQRLRTFGNPSENELKAINGYFTNLRNTLEGKTNARDAAEKLACSFIPG